MGAGDVAPIRADGLVRGYAWQQLLRSYAVLDSVVVRQKLFIQAPAEFSAQFATLDVDERFSAGDFELRVGPDGNDFVLATAEGAVLHQGRLGEPVGVQRGFRWTPPPGSFPAGAAVRFSVRHPRDAAQTLNGQLGTGMDTEGNFLSLYLTGTDPERLALVLNALMDRFIVLGAELTRAKLDEVLLILEEQLEYEAAELAQAEQELEEFRVRTISLPSDRSGPIAGGLRETRGPVFDMFFDLSVEVDQVGRDRERLERALDGFEESGEVRIEALEIIPSAARSSELRRILDELVDARSQLRVLTDRYSEEYPPVQDLLASIETIEATAIPRVVRGILSELADQESDLQSRVAGSGQELRAIPPRMIEERRLERQASITEELYNTLRSRVEIARLAAASSIPDMQILDRPQVPQQPSEDNRFRVISMILVACLGGWVGIAILLDRTDRRFRYATDVSREIGLDILGSIPRLETGRGARVVENAAHALEAFRELRIHTAFAYGSAGPIMLTISSPAAGEGKSLISSNLAVAFAEVGQRTILIDADTRRGDAHRLLGLQQSPGLTDYLRERSGQEIIQQSAHDNLDFIGCGGRGTSTPELLASSRMAYFMGTLKRSYDVIIVDSPPLASGGDPLILATLTGHLAVVIRTGATEKKLAHAKLDQLARLPIRILGAILNDVDPADSHHSYYSAYLPGYEPVPEEEDKEVQLLSGGS